MLDPRRQSFHEEGLAWKARLEAEEARLEIALRNHRAPLAYVCDRCPAPGFPLEERGVYVARYLSARGRYILDCIDRKGRHVAQVLVDDPGQWATYEQRARDVLDELDPGLKLIP